MTFHFSRQRQRGSALLFVVIMLAVLAVVGLAVITQANSEADGSAAKRQFDRSVSCADAARELIMSQFRLFGVQPASLTLNNVSSDSKIMRTGHFDQVSIVGIQAASGANQGNLGMTDRANKILRSNIGGQPFSIHIVCSSANNARQMEVEFLTRFGL
jgi:hypothetical protein